jgi:membrane-associated protease RseP (regulator of RpoE activity)
MGQYNDLVPNKKVAFMLRSDGDGDRSTCTVTISGKGTETMIILADSSDSKEWAKTAAEIEQGWNTALDNLKSVLETGVDKRYANRPMLGIDGFAPSPSGGVRIAGTVEGMGARAAGLRAGDVILSVGGVKTQANIDLNTALNGHKAGEAIKVAFARDGKKLNATVMLSARPQLEIPPTAEALAEIVARKYTEVNRDLTQAFKSVSEEKAARAPAPGEWSARHVLAHLVGEERYMHHWITCAIASQVPWQDDWPGNLRVRLDAIINGFPTIQALLTELKRNEAETVALLNALPDEFVARKGSYTRVAREMLTWPDHTREHLEQIKAAVR